MVVDASRFVRTQLGKVITDAGYLVTEAEDGEDAWDKMNAGTHPALIICDLNMPKMNGLEFLERLHADGTSQKVPVVSSTSALGLPPGQ